MMEKSESKDRNGSKIQKLGLCAAGLFYLVAIIMVVYSQDKEEFLDPSTQTITFAHWNLEDGFREGFDAAIVLFEKLKAEQGEKVKVIQTTVPYRGYRQWFITQLIGGNPADVLKIMCASDLMNKYFYPLSSHIAKPNPFNKGTIMEGVPWKDTYIDGMQGSLDAVYAEYFGVGLYYNTVRLFVNMDLLEKSTGSRKLPETFSEWLATCEKMREYGRRIGKPVIPIGVRGFDKGTLQSLFFRYYSQLNGNLNDDVNLFCAPSTGKEDIAGALVNGDADRERLLAAVEMIRDIGQYFCEGFTSVDLEQTKFLFASGNVGFFPEGTFNAYSMVKNSPFEVEIIPIPEISPGDKFHKYYTGRVSEQGISIGGQFGIPKSTKYFRLSLEFLQFISSYEINQMIFNHCKWPPAVREAKFEGLLAKFKPLEGGQQVAPNTPFTLAQVSQRKMLEDLETIIVEKKENPKEYFWKKFLDRTDLIRDELREYELTSIRDKTNLEAIRSSIAIALTCDGLSGEDKTRLNFRKDISRESYVSRIMQDCQNKLFMENLEKLKRLNAGKKEGE